MEYEEAWVELAPVEAAIPRPDHPYNFGFATAMTRLLLAHDRIGPALRQTFSEVMFSADSELTRSEREMVATVSSVAQDCFY